MRRSLLVSFLVTPYVVGCGPSQEETEAFWAAYDALAPIRTKLAAVDAALPPVGSEVTVACAPSVAAGELAVLNFSQLEYLLERPTKVEQWERMNLTEEGFQRVWSKADAQKTLATSKTPTSEAAGLKHAAETLTPVETLVVFRPTSVVSGELGESSEPGVRAIVRDAKWDGWALVYSFSDAPALLGAFPLSATNRPEVSRVVEQGKAIPDGDLLHDAMEQVEAIARARLAVPGCPATGR